MNHETSHTLGLNHTFPDEDNMIGHLFEKHSTDNIMDYSHWPSFGNKPRIITYHWQWKILNSNILPLNSGSIRTLKTI